VVAAKWQAAAVVGKVAVAAKVERMDIKNWVDLNMGMMSGE
jgi:hypothetical protein